MDCPRFEIVLGVLSNENRTERSGKVNNVRERTCYNCNKPGHIARFCLSRIKDSKVNSVYDKDDNVAGVFNVNGPRSKGSRMKEGKEITWILDLDQVYIL
jgi:hypothetical protein